MLNLGGIFGAFGRMLPGYVQGQRQAIADNWQDLQNYNAVQRGQIENAFNELTFPLAYNREYDLTALSRIAAQGGAMDLASRMMGYPAELGGQLLRNRYENPLRAARAEGAILQAEQQPMQNIQYQQMLQQLMQGFMPMQQAPQFRSETNMRQPTITQQP